MSLFKIFSGSESELNRVSCHKGYAYFTEDGGNLYIDVSDEDGGRVQINAYSASVLKNGTTEIDVDDIFLKEMTATVAQGGTGRGTLTANALIVGNGTNQVKMVSISKGGIVIGDSTNGVTALLGTGAIFAETSGTPKFGTLPVKYGGTGAITASAARANLDVYSKSETNTKVEEATTLAYSVTLASSGWYQSGDLYLYKYSNSNLTCGRDGNVPPIITWTSNQDSYNKIDSAEATIGDGILFQSSEQITEDIGIIVIDIK